MYTFYLRGLVAAQLAKCLRAAFGSW